MVDNKCRIALENIIMDLQSKTMKAEAEFNIVKGATQFYVSQQTYKGMLWKKYEELLDNYKKLYDKAINDGS